jgi:hypothetical protein
VARAPTAYRGVMNAIQYQARGAQQPIRLRVPLGHIKAFLGGLRRVLAESSKGSDLDVIFCHRADAQFAALSRSQQNALLDRGWRPR